MKPIDHEVFLNRDSTGVVFNSNNWSRSVRARRAHNSLHIRRHLQLGSRVDRSQRVRRKVVRGPDNVTRNVVRFIPINAELNRNSKIRRYSTRAFSFTLGRPVLITVARSKYTFNVNNRKTEDVDRHFTSIVVTFGHQNGVQRSPTQLFRWP